MPLFFILLIGLFYSKRKYDEDNARLRRSNLELYRPIEARYNRAWEVRGNLKKEYEKFEVEYNKVADEIKNLEKDIYAIESYLLLNFGESNEQQLGDDSKGNAGSQQTDNWQQTGNW